MVMLTGAAVWIALVSFELGLERSRG